MSRLFVKIYLTIIASLALLAAIVGTFWHFAADANRHHPAVELVVQLAAATLAPPTASQADQQTAIEDLSRRLHADLALYASNGQLMAAAGRHPPPPPRRDSQTGDWIPDSRGPAFIFDLRDGRRLVARSPHGARPPWAALGFHLLLAALAVGLAALPVARGLTRRLEKLQRAVDTLGAGDLSARVDISGKDEVASLAASFNRAAARIEELVAANKALLANTSHELRTPLARIRLGVELLRKDADPQRKADLERDIAELDQLIDEILTASRLDTVSDLGPKEEIDLLALAAEEAARYDNCNVGGESAVVTGDARLLRRMIRNLIENARRHGAPPIDIHVARTGREATLSVADHGPGIPDADRERVFEPFYRVPGRSAATGSGLGLALVRQIARRHGGDAVVSPGGQAEIKVSLPLQPGSA
ncbi:MAG: HAMP domain-containing protein, partial [Alphaproteobacteria bacterium]|nr:HAMP domain-containing protein [Alphaproteobacteria bacterium]